MNTTTTKKTMKLRPAKSRIAAHFQDGILERYPFEKENFVRVVIAGKDEDHLRTLVAESGVCDEPKRHEKYLLPVTRDSFGYLVIAEILERETVPHEWEWEYVTPIGMSPNPIRAVVSVRLERLYGEPVKNFIHEEAARRTAVSALESAARGKLRPKRPENARESGKPKAEPVALSLAVPAEGDPDRRLRLLVVAERDNRLPSPHERAKWEAEEVPREEALEMLREALMKCLVFDAETYLES